MISQAGRSKPRHDPWRELRQIDRDEVDFGTMMRRPGSRGLDARVVNLSSHGFMVRTEEAFQQGEQVSIKLPVLGEVTAKIAWALGGRVGGQFLTPVDPARYAEMLKKAYRPRLSWPG
jgi:proline racemase